jgi:hypothetical protein
MLAGKAKPRGCEKIISKPKGESLDWRGVCGKQADKHDRPLLAGKAKPKGCEKRASEPQGEN